VHRFLSSWLLLWLDAAILWVEMRDENLKSTARRWAFTVSGRYRTYESNRNYLRRRREWQRILES